MLGEPFYKDGTPEYPFAYIALENFIFIITFLIGAWGMRPLQVFGLPFISIVYLLFALIMLGFFLRKHLCTHCWYHGKACHSGWGKLSAAMYRKKSGNYDLGGKVVLPTWGVLLGLPLPIMVATILLGMVGLWVELWPIVLFIILLAVNAILHVRDCQMCRMRHICPGSAAKRK